MDGGVIAIHTERARYDVGVCQGGELYMLEDLDIQLHFLKKNTHTNHFSVVGFCGQSFIFHLRLETLLEINCTEV